MSTTRIALVLHYDGSAFNGWQVQVAGVPTVQTVLETALAKIALHPVATIVAGRTDTGVHATAQVVHFDTTAKRPLSAWVRGVNAHLPASVAVQEAYEVAPEFSARFDAYGRSYRYVLCNEAVRPVLLAGKVGWAFLELNVAAMQQAALCLVGEHDFSSFRASECQAKSPIKTMYSVKIARHGSMVCFDFHANAFLHHMVRNLVGALVYVGYGKLTAAEFESLLQAKDRTLAPPTFMPDGLYLTGVDYPEQFAIPKPAIPSWLWGSEA